MVISAYKNNCPCGIAKDILCVKSLAVAGIDTINKHEAYPTASQKQKSCSERMLRARNFRNFSVILKNLKQSNLLSIRLTSKC